MLVVEKLVEPVFAFVAAGFRKGDTVVEIRLSCGSGSRVIQHGQLVEGPDLAAGRQIG